MEVTNLRSSVLTRYQIKSLAFCLPSLHCGPTTDDEHFNQMWRQEMFDVRQFGTTSHLNTIPPSAAAARAESSGSRLETPVHPEEIDIQALANTQNHFSIMEFEGGRSVRVTSSVLAPDGREIKKKWRVSDYNLDGQIILSVICFMTTDMKIYSSEERRPLE